MTYDGVRVANAGIRLKGSSTFVGIEDRASFSIKFNEFVKVQRLAISRLP